MMIENYERFVAKNHHSDALLSIQRNLSRELGIMHAAPMVKINVWIPRIYKDLERLRVHMALEYYAFFINCVCTVETTEIIRIMKLIHPFPNDHFYASSYWAVLLKLLINPSTITLLPSSSLNVVLLILKRKQRLITHPRRRHTWRYRYCMWGVGSSHTSHDNLVMTWLEIHAAYPSPLLTNAYTNEAV